MWQKDVQKVTMRDFFGIIKRFQNESGISWSEKLYGLMCVLVGMDWRQKTDASDRAVPPKENNAKVSFAESKKDDFAIKTTAGNPMYDAYVMCAD